MTLADILAGIIFVALNAYALLGGADFGGGVWDLLARGPRQERQRELIADAIGPVWEANHVWLILAIVLLFTCFPPAFARLGTLLHIPLSLVLIGIVLRGSAFTFWRYGGGAHGDREQRRWGLLFAVASLITPLLLGATVGAIASGRLGEGGRGTGDGFYATYVASWLNPFALAVGLFALVAFAFLAAVYLTLEAEGERELAEDFRRRALAAGAGLFVAAVLVLVLALRYAPLVRDGLIFAAWAVPLHLLTAAAAITALVALWYRRWRAARLAAAVQVSLILWGWALGQHPYVLPPDLTIAAAAAPAATLRLVLGAVALGAVVLLPSLYYLLRARTAASVASPAISTVLRRPAAPAAIATALRDTPSRSARKRTSSALAAPSTGGAATRILIASPCRPATAVVRARGATCTTSVAIRALPRRRATCARARRAAATPRAGSSRAFPWWATDDGSARRTSR